jgi:hypothetical protein
VFLLLQSRIDFDQPAKHGLPFACLEAGQFLEDCFTLMVRDYFSGVVVAMVASSVDFLSEADVGCWTLSVGRFGRGPFAYQ